MVLLLKSAARCGRSVRGDEWIQLRRSEWRGDKTHTGQTQPTLATQRLPIATSKQYIYNIYKIRASCCLTWILPIIELNMQ